MDPKNNAASSQEASESPQKKKMALWKKILIGVGVFIVLIVWIAFAATSGATKVVKKELNLLKSGDLKGAYALTSVDFQKSTSYDKFLAFLDAYPSLKNNAGHTFAKREIENGIATITGTLKSKDGAITPIEIKLVKEKEGWKILSLNLNQTGAGASTSSDSAMDASSSGVKLENTFQDPSLGYSVKYPADWSYEKPDSVTVLFSGSKNTPAFYSTINIQNIKTASGGGNYGDVNDLIKDLKNQIKKLDKGASISDIQDINYTLANGTVLAGKQFVAEYNYNGKAVKQMQLAVPHGDGLTLHGLAYTSPKNQYDTHADIAKAILASWAIISK